MINEAAVRIRKLDDNTTITLKCDARELRTRLAIGAFLIKLGCRVIGMGFKIEMNAPVGEATGADPGPEV